MPKHCVADTSFFNCKAKDLIIANLENIVAKYKGETKHWNLENKIEDTKLIIKQQKELEKKEEEINNYKNILKALEFYKSFTAQQSQFINFLSEMKHLETENEELKAKIKVFQQIAKEKNKTGIVEKTSSKTIVLDQTLQQKLKIILEHIAKNITEIESIITSNKFKELMDTLKEPLLPTSTVEIFINKTPINISHNSTGFFEHNLHKRKNEPKKIIFNLRKKFNDAVNELLNYLKPN